MGEYHDLYLKNGALFLADAFHKFEISTQNIMDWILAIISVALH